MGVDQTNESVIVGDTAVVKWATHLQSARTRPPADRRVRDAGFGGMPRRGAWSPGRRPGRRRDPGGQRRQATCPAQSTVGHGPSTSSPKPRCDRRSRSVHRCGGTDVGKLVCRAARRCRHPPPSHRGKDAARWRDAAVDALETVCALPDSDGVHVCTCAPAVSSRPSRTGLGGLAGTPIIEGHGDLHVGQVLRSGGTASS